MYWVSQAVAHSIRQVTFVLELDKVEFFILVVVGVLVIMFVLLGVVDDFAVIRRLLLAHL